MNICDKKLPIVEVKRTEKDTKVVAVEAESNKLKRSAQCLQYE